MNRIFFFLVFIFFPIAAFPQYEVDWSVAPVNPVPYKYTLDHYNINGDVTKRTRVYSIMSSSIDFDTEGKQTSSDGGSYKYNSSGALNKYTTMGYGTSYDIETDSRNRIIKMESDDTILQFSYDGNGNLSKEYENGSLSKSYSYDNQGRVIEAELYSTEDGMFENKIELAYSNTNNYTKVQIAFYNDEDELLRREVEYYDEQGHFFGRTNPGDPVPENFIEKDLLGNVLYEISGNGEEYTYAYSYSNWYGMPSGLNTKDRFRPDLAWNSKELLNDIAGLYSDLCFSFRWEEAQAFMHDNPDMFSIGQSSRDDETYAKLKHPSVLNQGKEVSFRINQDYCQVAYFPNTGSLYENFKDAVTQNASVELEYDYLTDYIDENKDGDEEVQTYYKTDAWDFPSINGLRVRVKRFNQEVNGEWDNWVNARVYNYDRSEATQMIKIKGQPWEVVEPYGEEYITLNQRSLFKTGAGIQVDTGEGILSIWTSDKEGVDDAWTFIPNFYSRSASSDSYFKIQSDIFVDDSPESLPAYEKCKQRIVKCAKYGNGFSMPVDEQSIQVMKSGNKIEFQAETTAGERYHIIISLDGFTAAYNEAKSTSLYGY